MTIKELRIGNYINYFNKLVEVASLSKSMIDATAIAGRIHGRFIYNNGFVTNEADAFDPIPLTSAWLEMADFKLDRGIGVWFGPEMVPYNYFTIWDSYGDVPFKYTRSSPSNIMDMLYVHQLQNLYFALTGKELEFKDQTP